MEEISSPQSGRRFALLYNLSQTFDSSLDLAEVLDRVMDEVVKALKAERGFVALCDEDGGLDFRSARGIDQTPIDHPEFEISNSVIEEVIKQGEGVWVSDALQDNRFRSRSSVLNLNLRSILCAPLQYKDKLIGVIYVDNRIRTGMFTADDLELLEAIASSAAIAIENARLYELAIEKGRLERELQMAFRVQSSLIPDQIPQVPGWEFAACWYPARQVSGDFYDFIPDPANPEGSMDFVIADVTDKGMPAALFMALTRSLVRSSLDQAVSLSEGISKANRLICSDSTLSMPVTLFACQLDLKTGRMNYVNGGHNPPMYFSSESRNFTYLTRTGIFLGFDVTAEYQQRSISIAPGDFVVCYTDGVLDAINDCGQSFDMQRFQSLIWDHFDGTAHDLMEAIKTSVLDFCGDVLPYDDLTVLIIRRTGAGK